MLTVKSELKGLKLAEMGEWLYLSRFGHLVYICHFQDFEWRARKLAALPPENLIQLFPNIHGCENLLDVSQEHIVELFLHVLRTCYV